MLDVNKEVVSALARSCSEDRGRYALGGILVEEREKGAGSMTATNGAVLVQVDFGATVKPVDRPALPEYKSAPNGASRAILDGGELARAVGEASKACDKKTPALRRPVLIMGENVSTVVGSDRIKTECKTVPNMEGTYPNYYDVMRSGRCIAEVTLDAAELRRALSVVEAMHADNPKGAMFTLRFFGEKHALRLDSQCGAATFRGLVMPCNLPAFPKTTPATRGAVTMKAKGKVEEKK
jgi:hypothetical protein